MTKGLSLEELKKQLEGSAQQKVEEQEKYIHKLEGQLQKAKLKNIEQDKEAYYLFNRCRCLSYGTLCDHCGLSQRCHDIRMIYDNQIDGKPATVDEVISAECKQDNYLTASQKLELAMLIGQNDTGNDLSAVSICRYNPEKFRYDLIKTLYGEDAANLYDHICSDQVMRINPVPNNGRSVAKQLINQIYGLKE